MTLTKTIEINIDIDQIIDEYDLDSNSSWYRIMVSVDDYVAGFDDCEYYLIEYEDKRAIAQTIAEKLDVYEEDDEE